MKTGLFFLKNILLSLRMPSITIKVDFQRDLWNWLSAISKKSSHGMNWERFIPEDLALKINNKSQEEITGLVTDFLRGKYGIEKDSFIKYASDIQGEFNKITDQIFFTMERITEKPICRDSFTGFITTFPRGPYNTKEGFIWMIFDKKRDWQIMAFIHELLHMQFEYYYKEELLKTINIEQFDFLREAMTIIINQEFQDLTQEQDKGYPIHQEFRKYLIKLWEQKKDFSQFIYEAVKHIDDFRKNI